MDNIRALVNNDINTIENNICNLINSNNDIIKDIEKFINGPSKRVRSIICLLYLKANNININKPIIKILSAGELIHNASLLHDDVIDNSDIRRGEIAFHKKYDPKTSVLSGDYLLSIAVKELLELKNDDIIQIFLNATTNMSIAELLQYTERHKNTSIEHYLKIIEGKTASLFEAILKSTALLSNIDTLLAAKFGKLFGLLFQINNDSQNDSIINDKKNGIKTIIDIVGIEKTESLKDNYKEEMRKIVRSLPNKKYSDGLEDLVNLL